MPSHGRFYEWRSEAARSQQEQVLPLGDSGTRDLSRLCVVVGGEYCRSVQEDSRADVCS